MKKKNLIASYDTCNITEEQILYLMETEGISRDEAEKRAYNDMDLFNFAWEVLQENITEYMHGNTYWLAQGKNMGWRNLTGSKVFEAEDGHTLLRAILPDTDVTLYVWKHYKGFKLKVHHHDAPMGETYILKPINAVFYDKLN